MGYQEAATRESDQFTEAHQRRSRAKEQLRVLMIDYEALVLQSLAEGRRKAVQPRNDTARGPEYPGQEDCEGLGKNLAEANKMPVEYADDKASFTSSRHSDFLVGTEIRWSQAGLNPKSQA